MVAGLALLLLSFAVAQSTPPESAAPPQAQSQSTSELSTRPAPEPIPDQTQLQIDELGKEYDSIHLFPPLILMGAGIWIGGIGVWLQGSNQCTENGGRCFPVVAGAGAALAFIAFPVGLIWLVVDLINLAALSGEIKDLEAQRAMASTKVGASHRPSVAPWARWGASGLALSVPL